MSPPSFGLVNSKIKEDEGPKGKRFSNKVDLEKAWAIRERFSSEVQYIT